MSVNWRTREAGHARARDRMIHHQLAGRDIDDQLVLSAMGAVPRERFVPPSLASHACADVALPIGHGASISRPYVVALTLQMARLSPAMRVLEIGTGSGYLAAVASEIGARVETVELDPRLAEAARIRLDELGCDVVVHTGDGYLGWPTRGPYDAIILSAGVRRIPRELDAQLARGGRLVAPVGGPDWQDLVMVRRTEVGHQAEIGPTVFFEPMLGRALD